MPSRTVPSPFGPLALSQEGDCLTALSWGDGGSDGTPLLHEAERQLAAYFARFLTAFDLPLAPEVSPSQVRFLDALRAIPFGETRTYGDLARDLNISPQAAGQACGANPLPVLIPCHRVLGTGNLGGFSAPGGIETKVALLRLEGAASLLI
ncbi:methylated-DNA--[protein]-cysteine S-methyltransferase [Silicimonas algicola]|uniref:Methylated-DNA-[protein]-cysteine S-methyltransferase n=1 Tax=Silicimonas algicola TaxID=1826607 RepID=A0A316GDE9_9RHOB|nr:methylated-DNA--[protein]-cysteine S-methyltransferase [Silicimonas algicola]AZQ66407.1 methylated-DNA--[protein]-cysteine S-methyltransferase [Silicimonas algicola]PWK58742.1 methylated-DNA-[protein]-cysteine S-methyltransferase [Silicimonas algicola]